VVFRVLFGNITRVDGFRDRAEALEAAGLEE
jgi:hypothetical protein